jgi:hypothetical protein
VFLPVGTCGETTHGSQALLSQLTEARSSVAGSVTIEPQLLLWGPLVVQHPLIPWAAMHPV